MGSNWGSETLTACLRLHSTSVAEADVGSRALVPSPHLLPLTHAVPMFSAEVCSEVLGGREPCRRSAYICSSLKLDLALGWWMSISFN